MLKKAAKSERNIWFDKMITLLALELMSFFYYGSHVLALGIVCLTASLVSEIICLKLMNRKFTADDLSCTSDALIISLMLPASMDFGIAAIACIFAVVAAKNIFGGRFNMIFSPAAAAYVFMYTSWKSQLLMFPEPHTNQGISEKASGLVSSASHIFNTTGTFSHSDFELIMGNFSAPSGASSILLLTVSAVVLILRKDISAGASAGTVFGTAFLAYVAPVTNNLYDSVKYSLATNMVLFSAVYIISDKRIAPKDNLYAFFCGLITGAAAYIVVLTSAKENAIVLISVLFTPVALGFRNLENRIELAAEKSESAESPEITDENTGGEEAVSLE